MTETNEKGGFGALVGIELTGALKLQNIVEPTEVQKRLIPLILEKKDVIAQSETGSGKTLAYLLPIFKLLNHEVNAAQAVIIAPTHELASQIHKEALKLACGANSRVGSALIIGGANLSRQLDELKKKPKIIIGSAGRILELIGLKKLSVHYVRVIVIDEADKLLDDNNIDMVSSLIRHTLRERQIIMLSASITEKAAESGAVLMKTPELVRINGSNPIPSNIGHIYFSAVKRDKVKVLRQVIHSLKIKKGLVFVNNPNTIQDITERLNFHGIKSVAVYGGALKNERRLALSDFRSGAADVLVASDLAARGLDIAGLKYIINLDAPEKAEEYQHRAGRAGRNGEPSLVITVATEYEKRFLKKYENAFGIKIEKKEMSYGKIEKIKSKGERYNGKTRT